jgi:hypothetical protein
MQNNNVIKIIGLLIVLAGVILIGSLVYPLFGMRVDKSGHAVEINYSMRDVDNGEARWNSKKIDTYQIEVHAGGITPPPPIYVVQVWQGQVVFAMYEYRGNDGVHAPQQNLMKTDDAKRYSVPGLFKTARDLASVTDPLSALMQGGATFYSPGGNMKMQIRAQFNTEYGYPESTSSSAPCPDCASFSNVTKFVPFSSSAPPPTPTMRPTAIPTATRTPRP